MAISTVRKLAPLLTARSFLLIFFFLPTFILTLSASLSKDVVTDILREEMGYNGVVITDALNMSAISEYYDSAQAAVMALKAGADMVLMPEDFEAAYEGVLAAIEDGTISEARINDSLARVYKIKK